MQGWIGVGHDAAVQNQAYDLQVGDIVSAKTKHDS